ncbi:MAG: OsmC family protein [Zetaproteobacteria bacterium]|nr:OsmC family protein [Zetaproteobacteria bacterium]
MARLVVTHEDGAAFKVSCRGHELMMDQPESNNGKDLGPTPPEFFGASMAGCVGYYVARYCQQVGISTEGLRVECDWSVAEDSPRRIANISMLVHLPSLPENRQKAVQKVAHSCLIHATLMNAPEIEVDFTVA